MEKVHRSHRHARSRTVAGAEDIKPRTGCSKLIQQYRYLNLCPQDDRETQGFTLI